jgi:hypothetical protein
MTTTMFLLLQAEPGLAPQVADFVGSVPGVIGTAVTSGPYDVIGLVDAAGAAQSRAVLDAVRQADGLARLCVCWPQHEARRAVTEAAQASV